MFIRILMNNDAQEITLSLAAMRGLMRWLSSMRSSITNAL